MHVNDNQPVKAGDVLVEIDPHDYQIAVSRAEADLAAAEAAASAARSTVPVTSATTSSQLDVARTGTTNAEAALHAAERETDASRAKLNVAKAKLAEVKATATRAAQDLERLKPLVAKDEVSKQQFDAAVSADQSATRGGRVGAGGHRRGAGQRRRRRREAGAGGRHGEFGASRRRRPPRPRRSRWRRPRRGQGRRGAGAPERAALDQAKLNLERATVRAPSTGVVCRKTIEVGQIVQAGQPLLALTALDTVWVTANFKETQLREMRTGQRADVSVDAYGGDATRRHVDSIAAATGATFSLLPPDNASGNFVKVVQRVPVKIVIDGGQDAAAVLRPGMSVNATVFVR